MTPVDRFCGSFKLFALDGTPIPHDQCWMAEALTERWPVIGRQIVIERPDGTRRVVLAHASPLFDTAGNLEGAVNVLTDITELKQAKQALADNEALLRHFIKQTPVAVAMFDNDMRYLQTSDRWLEPIIATKRKISSAVCITKCFPTFPIAGKKCTGGFFAGAVERSDRDTFVRADGSAGAGPVGSATLAENRWLHWRPDHFHPAHHRTNPH